MSRTSERCTWASAARSPKLVFNKLGSTPCVGANDEYENVGGLVLCAGRSGKPHERRVPLQRAGEVDTGVRVRERRRAQVGYIGDLLGERGSGRIVGEDDLEPIATIED